MKVYLEPGDVARLEEAATNLRDRLLVRVCSHLGCRVSEALGLEVKRIDFTGATVTIEHLKLRVRVECPNCRAGLKYRKISSEEHRDWYQSLWGQDNK